MRTITKVYDNYGQARSAVSDLESAGIPSSDIGSGGGLPIIPCLIARPDLEATLIESSQKKVVFLREALNRLGLRAVDEGSPALNECEWAS